MSVVRLVVPLAVLLLAACGDDPAPATEQGGSASGEILPGSLSDDMIPTDTLRSEAPHIVERPAGATSGAAADPAAQAGEEVVAEGEAEAAPAPEAAAE